MNVEQDTGNAEKLPLHKRVKQELLLSELLELEHDGDLAGRNTLSRAIQAAIGYGDLAAVDVPPVNEPGAMLVFLSGDWLIDRESYRQWRAQCPARLLSDLSYISLWLGATPALPESLPVETSLPESPERGIALVEAENAALVALRKALKREPDFDEFWDYLTAKDKTGTVADYTDSRLDWIGHSGKSCSTAKSTIRNRLTAAKKRNPFTPS